MAFYQEDGLGSTLGVVNNFGDRQTRYLYDAYGNVKTLADSSYWASPNKFVGQKGYYNDQDSGMLLLGHRYYLPAIGRFLTPDPIGQEGGLNLYAYCDNNPLAHTDPSGLDHVDEAIRSSFTVAGEVTGWWAGGTAGGAGGTVVAPGAGTAAGAVGGRVAGGAIGAFVGRGLAEIVIGLRHGANYVFSGGSSDSDGPYEGGASGVNFPDRTVQKVYGKHGHDFGMTENWTKATGPKFAQWIRNFLDSPHTVVIKGTYRKTMSVFHHFDSRTGLNVMIGENRTFMGGWKLDADQIANLHRNGNVQ